MGINVFKTPAGNITGAARRDGTEYTSVLDMVALERLLDGDPRFDPQAPGATGPTGPTGARIFRVDITYGETSESRQQKLIQHFGGEGKVNFTSMAKATTWSQQRAKIFDHDGASRTLLRERLRTAKARGSLTGYQMAITGDPKWGGDGLTQGDWFLLSAGGGSVGYFIFDPDNTGIPTGTVKVTGEYGLGATGVAANIMNAITGSALNVSVEQHGAELLIENNNLGVTGDVPMSEVITFSGPAVNSTGSLNIQFDMAAAGGMGASADGYDQGDYFRLSDGTTIEIFEISPTGTISVPGATGIFIGYGRTAPMVADAIAIAITGDHLINMRVVRSGCVISLIGPTGANNIPITEVVSITGGSGTFGPSGMSYGTDVVSLNLYGMSGGRCSVTDLTVTD